MKGTFFRSCDRIRGACWHYYRAMQAATSFPERRQRCHCNITSARQCASSYRGHVQFQQPSNTLSMPEPSLLADCREDGCADSKDSEHFMHGLESRQTAVSTAKFWIHAPALLSHLLQPRHLVATAPKHRHDTLFMSAIVGLQSGAHDILEEGI